jgi:hypothetical protein
MKEVTIASRHYHCRALNRSRSNEEGNYDQISYFLYTVNLGYNDGGVAQSVYRYAATIVIPCFLAFSLYSIKNAVIDVCCLSFILLSLICCSYLFNIFKI